MIKIKTILVSKMAFLFSFGNFDKNKIKSDIESLKLKKATIEEIEKSRCKQYEYAA